MTTIPEALTMALEHHRGGNIQQAETIYRQILQVDPVHAEALHYLGLIAHQVGKHDIAVDYLERSLALVPESPVFHSNLGLAYQALGKLDQATASYREALRLQPDYADAHNNLANALAEQGKLDEAVGSYQRALALNPNIAAPHYNLGAALAKLGKLDEAAASYRQALLLKPDHFKAHLNLGIVLREQNKLEEAVEQFQQALRLDPRHAAAHNNLGNALKKQGKLDEAVASYRLALHHQPDCAEAYFNLGNLYADQMRLEPAIDCFKEAMRLKPATAEAVHQLGVMAHQKGKSEIAVEFIKQALVFMPENEGFYCSLGTAYTGLGRLDEAKRSYQEALRLRPNLVVGHLNLATVFAHQGNLDEAIAGYRRALVLNPNIPDTHSNLGLALQRLGNSEEAEAHYRQALSLNPDFLEARLNLGITQSCQEKLGEAVLTFKETIRLKPDFAQAHHNLGIVLQMQERPEEAITSYREALRLQPDYALAHGNLANALHFQGYVDEAEIHLREAIRLLGLRKRPTAHLRIALATLLPVIYQSVADLQSWRRRLTEEIGQLREQQVVDDLTEETLVNFFYLPYQGLNDREIRRDFARLHRVPTHHGPIAMHRATRIKIRVGFLSAFFREHTIGHLMLGLVAKLSREAFEVIVLSIGRNDDAIAGLFKQHADRYLEVPRHLPMARRLIAEQQLDVLFYPDIGMDPFASTLAFSRLARVQCTSWGHPVTTGLDTIDYFISSEALETEGAEDHYTETLVRLKELPIYYYRPELPVPLKTRADFGLAEGAHLYACPQSLFKLHPEFDEVLGGILRNDHQGLLLLSSGFAPQGEALLRKRFAASLRDVMDRIHFLPKLSRPDFLNLLAVADVLLDPLHFGGGNTSYEGLAFGIPIITLPSRFLRGRITFALYQQMQLLDCVAHGPQEYIELALRLGTDPSYREMVRDKIRCANDVLFENSEGIRELEQFFRQAVAATPLERTGAGVL